MPSSMSRPGRLDHAVGVEHDRVAAAEHALVGDVGDGRQVGDHAEHDAAGARRSATAPVLASNLAAGGWPAE